MEICDNNFYNTSDGYSGEIEIGGFVFAKDNSGNYSIDGYRYSGRIENNNRNKIYNVKQGKAFSIPLDKSDDRNFIINGYTAMTENRNITKDSYGIKPSRKYAESMEVKANGITVVTKTGVLETFIEQCQNILLDKTSLLGEWLSEDKSKGYVFYEDHVVRKTYSISDGTPLTTSGTYDYSILNGHILIQRKVGNYNETIEDKIISLLSDNELQTIDEYTISAWNDRKIYQRVND